MPCCTVYSTRCYTLLLLTSVNAYNSPPFISSADPSFHAPSPSRQIPTTTSAGISFSAAASDLVCIKQHIIIHVKRVALADCTATWQYWQGTLSPTPNRHFARIAQHKWPVRCRSRFLALENSSGSMWLAQKRSILMNTLCG